MFPNIYAVSDFSCGMIRTKLKFTMPNVFKKTPGTTIDGSFFLRDPIAF